MIYKAIRISKLILVFALISVSVSAQKFTGFFHISGRIRVESGEPTGAVALLTNVSTKANEKRAVVDLTGKFEFDLNYFKEYKLTISKADHYTKDIDISTIIPQQIWAKDSIFPPFIMVITIYKRVPGVTLSFEGKTVGKLCYSPKGKLDNFDADIYIDDKEIRKEIDQANKALEDELFNKKMAEAIDFEKKNMIREAIKAYEEALALRKNDQFIKPKLKELASDLKNLEKDAQLDADFSKLLATGDDNVAKLKYAEAVGNFKEALSIKPGNQIATAKLANAEKLLAGVLAEKAAVEAEFKRLLAAGDENVSAKKYPEAIDNFKGALSIKRGDPVATSKLANAEQLLDKLNAEKAKAEAGFASLLAAGDENVSRQKYPEAIDNFKGALAIKAGDKVATAKLVNAEQLLAKAIADKAAEEKRLAAEKAKQDSISAAEKARLAAEKLKQEALLAAEKARKDSILAADKARQAAEKLKQEALAAAEKARQDSIVVAEKARKAAEKLKQEALLAAEKARKDSILAAEKARKEIEKKLAEEKARQEALLAAEKAKEAAEKARQDAEFNRLLALGDENVTGKKFREAIDNFKGALVIKAGDKVATAKLANAEQLLAKAIADKATEEKRLAAEKAKQDSILAAEKARQAAEKLRQEALLAAERARQDSILAVEKVKREAEKAKQEAEFNRLLNLGNENVTSQKYAEAIDNFKGALLIKPGEPVATKKLAEAEKLLATFLAEKSKMEAEAQRKLQGENSYQKNIQTADENYAKSLWTVAIFYYQEALKFKSADKYAQDRVDNCKKMIDSNITGEKMQLYNAFLKRADDDFQAKKYSSARFYYGKASEILPWENYPAGQLKVVEKLISSTDANGTEEQYFDAIKKAEDAVAKKNLAIARFYFQKAISLKPDEDYPKQQLKRITTEF